MLPKYVNSKKTVLLNISITYLTKLNTKSIKYLLTNVEDSFPSQPTIKTSTDEEKGLFYHGGIQMPLKEKKYIRPIENDYMSGHMVNYLNKVSFFALASRYFKAYLQPTSRTHRTCVQWSRLLFLSRAFVKFIFPYSYYLSYFYFLYLF